MCCTWGRYIKRLATNEESNIDPFGQEENEEVGDRLNHSHKKRKDSLETRAVFS